MIGDKVCPGCGHRNSFGTLSCNACGRWLRLSKAEGVFDILTTPWRLKLFVRVWYRQGRAVAGKLFEEFCNPLYA